MASRRAIIEGVVREDKDTHLVPPPGPAAIAAAVERLRCPERRRRLSQGARTRFEACSLESVGRQWADPVRRAWLKREQFPTPTSL